MTDSSSPIVVGVDGSDESLAAVVVAVNEAKLRNTSLHIVHCSDVTPAILHLSGGVDVNTTDLAARDHEDVWAKVAPIVEGTGVDVVRVDLNGYPPDELVKHGTESNAAMIVVGRRGRGRVASAVLGSTSMRVLERATCPVLIAPSP